MKTTAEIFDEAIIIAEKVTQHGDAIFIPLELRLTLFTYIVDTLNKEREFIAQMDLQKVFEEQDSKREAARQLAESGRIGGMRPRSGDLL